ncbi:ring finger protein 146 [Anticarsia gemmatalis]|uniref:ring finger protein 146 n=1 Tax=Anticarsia gemmatalis TaxID=129554 RepID=UPI003F777BFD
MMNDDEDTIKLDADCAVCLQKCNHPTQLPCGHIFCFLCVKGIAFQSKKCAMCRAEIPANYLDNPVLLETVTPEEVTTDNSPEIYQWFYEGRNGWWKYDERSNTELETAYNAGDPICTLLLAGTLYNIDFQSMTQVRRSDQTRRRRVRRDSPTFPAKGIAGIKTDNTNIRQSKSDDESDDVAIIEVVSEVIEITDSEDNVMETEHQQPDDVIEIVDSLSAVNLAEQNVSQDHEDT